MINCEGGMKDRKTGRIEEMYGYMNGILKVIVINKL